MDEFNKHKCKDIGIGGLGCPCCNGDFGKTKKALSKRARHRLKEQEMTEDYGEEKMKHSYSIEKLYHFTCCKCKAWWSIGDWHQTSSYITGKVTCPHCGATSNYKENEK